MTFIILFKKILTPWDTHMETIGFIVARNLNLGNFKWIIWEHTLLLEQHLQNDRLFI